MKYKLTADYKGLSEALEIIKERLTKYKLHRKDIQKNILAAEEVMNALLEHAENAENIYLSIRRFLDEVSIEISMSGKEFQLEKELNPGTPINSEDLGVDTERAIRGMILKSFLGDIKYRHRAGVNTIRIVVTRFKRASLYLTLGAIILAIGLGILVKSFVPETIYMPVNDNVLDPVKTIYMNALKMIVAPVVFFSIVSCIGHFSDLSELGRIGGKTIGMYLLTTIIATLLGTGVVYLLSPGVAGSFNIESAGAAIETQTIDISFKDMLINIVPNNFFRPFLESQMLQLIFLAVLCGIAVGMIGKYSRVLNEFFTACNELFLKITSLIIKFMPVAVLCSILSMFFTTGTDALISILGILGTFVLAIIFMMVVYCLLILIFARLNPIKFLKKYSPTMLQVFSMGSSNAALPLNIEACKKLGVSQKVYSLSLPLGATMNMDGTCIYLSVFAFALARICGVTIPPAAIISVLISIIVLSVGAPGTPGSGLVCLSVLLTQLNVPIEALALVMGIDSIMGMMRCMSNCLGDTAVGTIVAKQEGLLDVETYNNKI